MLLRRERRWCRLRVRTLSCFQIFFACCFTPTALSFRFLAQNQATVARTENEWNTRCFLSEYLLLVFKKGTTVSSTERKRSNCDAIKEGRDRQIPPRLQRNEKEMSQERKQQARTGGRIKREKASKTFATPNETAYPTLPHQSPWAVGRPPRFPLAQGILFTRVGAITLNRLDTAMGMGLKQLPHRALDLDGLHFASGG